MFRFLLRRLALTIPTFVALMFVTFVAIRLVPGDPVEVRVGERGISPERLAQFRHELGLDQPVWKQFADYCWQLLHGDFGTSLATNQKVLTEFAALFPATIELSLAAMLLAVLLGIPAGTIAAARRGSVYDQALMGMAVTGYSMPIFWWGLLLIMFVGERWGLTPVSGRIDLIQYYFDPVTGFMTIDATRSLETAASGWMPNTSTRIGVMSAPPPMPVSPTMKPTPAPARAMSQSMCMVRICPAPGTAGQVGERLRHSPVRWWTN